MNTFGIPMVPSALTWAAASTDFLFAAALPSGSRAVVFQSWRGGDGGRGEGGFQCNELKLDILYFDCRSREVAVSRAFAADSNPNTAAVQTTCTIPFGAD
jgi:hypothetical protein